MFDNDIVDFRIMLIKPVKFGSGFLFTLKSSATFMKLILALRTWTAKVKFQIVTLISLCRTDEWLYELHSSRDDSRANAVPWLGGQWNGGTIFRFTLHKIGASSQYTHGRAVTVRDSEKLKEWADRSFMRESKDINYYLIYDYL